jgi:bacteriorhodopsin
MLVSLLQPQDIAGGSYALLLIITLVTTVLLLLGTAWSPPRWKTALALAAMAALASSLSYLMGASVWFATGKITIIHRYVGWFVTLPLQVMVLYFFVASVGRLTLGLFWRLLVASVVMVLARFMGEVGLMHPTLGFLIGLALWLYLLGEAYFGRMAEVCAKDGNASVRRGYFWMRLVLTIGWAVYPLCYFISAFSGGIDVRPLTVTYNLADLVNLVAYTLAVLTIAMSARNSDGV